MSLSNLTDVGQFERIVLKLIFQHAHSNDKRPKAEIAKYLTNGLDFGEAMEKLERASDELSFVHTKSDYVWYEQNEALLLYIENNTSRELGIIGKNFSHLTPPTLRGEYDLPPPDY